MTEHIQLIIGPMFSGKTTELIRRLERYVVSKKSVIAIKYIDDDRYDSDKIATHNGRLSSFETITSTKDIESLPDLSQYDVIGIDEGQFFENVVEFAEYYAKRGKIIVISALNGSFERKPFESIVPLYALAEKIDYLNAICMLCGENGFFSKRLIHSTSLELIGKNDLYEARCRTCFNL